MLYYIAGPMRGIKYYNHPRFDEAADMLEADGHKCINPAQVDRNVHLFDPTEMPEDSDWHKWPENMDVANVIDHCIDAVKSCDAVYALENWQSSRGATAEIELARWMGKPVHEAQESILIEAERITSGDRQASYGPPDQDFRRTAEMWTGLFGHKFIAGESFAASDVAMAMICLKLSRETHQKKRDNAVDIAGYAKCLNICNEAKTKRIQKMFLGAFPDSREVTSVYLPNSVPAP